MVIEIGWLEFSLLVVTIVIVVVGVYIIRALKQLTSTLKTIGRLVEQSESDVVLTLQNMGNITNHVEDMSKQVNTMVTNVSGFTKNADRWVVRPLGAFLSTLTRRKKHTSE